MAVIRGYRGLTAEIKYLAERNTGKAMLEEIRLEDVSGRQHAIAVFGGTFDPVHAGHLDLIRALVGKFDKVIIAPTSQNPWKANRPADFVDRLEMLRLALAQEGLALSSLGSPAGLSIFESGYVYAVEVVRSLRASHPALPLYWTIGADIAGEPSKWKDFEGSCAKVLVAPIRIDVHSTEIRKGVKEFHPAIADYINKKSLYRS